MHSVPSGRRAIRRYGGSVKNARKNRFHTGFRVALYMHVHRARTRIEPNECANTNVYYYYYHHRHRHRRYTTMMIILYGRRRSRLVRGGDGELSPPESVARRPGTRDDSRAAVRETRSTGSAVAGDAKIFTTRATSSLRYIGDENLHTRYHIIITVLYYYYCGYNGHSIVHELRYTNPVTFA